METIVNAIITDGTKPIKASFNARKRHSQQITVQIHQGEAFFSNKLTLTMSVVTANELATALTAAVYNSRQIKLKQRKNSVASVVISPVAAIAASVKPVTIGDAMKQVNPEGYKMTEEIVNREVSPEKTPIENAVEAICRNADLITEQGAKSTDKERSDAISTFHAKNPQGSKS